MAGVAAQGIMLGAGESLERALHDVAAGAKGVVVLHVVPADAAEPRATDDEHRRGSDQADLHPAWSRFDPPDNRQAAARPAHADLRAGTEAHTSSATPRSRRSGAPRAGTDYGHHSPTPCASRNHGSTRGR